MIQRAQFSPLNEDLISNAVTAALKEDLGLAGDVTTNATVAEHATATADLTAREAGIISGLDVAEAAFSRT